MKTIKASLAYILAFTAIPVVLIAFVGLRQWAVVLVDKTGLTISPRYTGGPVIHKVDHGTYKTSIHEPVFESLFGQSKDGFVQIDWGKKKDVPSSIAEEIDYDADGDPDFKILWDRTSNNLLLKPHRSEIGELIGHYELAERYVIRVHLTSRK